MGCRGSSWRHLGGGVAVDAELEEEVGGQAGAVGLVGDAGADVVVAAGEVIVAAAAAGELVVALEALGEGGAAGEAIAEAGPGGGAADFGWGDVGAGAGTHAAGEAADGHAAGVAGGATELGPRHRHLVE